MVQTTVAITPAYPPPVGYNPSVVTIGRYTDIVGITAPDSASAGSRVDVTVRIKNIDSLFDHLVACVAIADGTRFIDAYANIRSLQTGSFTGSFTMPSKNVTIYVYSYYPVGPDWILDDEATKDVDLTVVEWVLLATRSISLDITAPPEIWLQVAERSISIGIAAPPEVWVLAAEKEISLGIAAPPTEWILLETRTIDIGLPPPIPPEYELIQHTIYPYAYVYDGDAEISTFTFTTDPFTPANWLAKKFTDTLESETEKKGGRVIEVRVYVDTTPLLWKNFIIEVIGTPLGEAVESSGTAVFYPIPIWAAILIACLAIGLLIIIITWSIKTIVGTFTHKPISEEVKKAMSREALIVLIGDFEDKLERPITPVEELEKMSDSELRVYCDQLAEEIAPPVAPSMWPWIILGAAGIVAGGFVLSQMAKKK